MSNELILVVDDDLEQRQAVSLILGLAGYETMEACDGNEALTLLGKNRYSLVISDIAMPGMNGYQFLQQIRRQPAWIHIPVLFLTGRHLDSDVRFGKELGIDDYLIKPIMAEDLLAVVNGKLLRARQLQTNVSIQTNEARITPLFQECERAKYLRVDEKQHRVWLEDKLIQLSAREFRLLAYLANHEGEVVHLQTLLKRTHAIEADAVEAGSLIRPMIRTIRRKLGVKAGDMGCIENVRGVGYRLICPQRN